MTAEAAVEGPATRRRGTRTVRFKAFLWTLRTVLSHWRRRPGQLAALLAGLMLATALWSGVQGLNAEARRSYAEAAAAVGGAELAELVPTVGASAPQSLFATLRRSGWPVSPVVEGRVRVGEVSLRVLGLEPLTAPPGGALRAGLSEADDAALLLGDPPGALVAPETLARLGVEAGARPGTERGPLPTLTPREDAPAGTVVMDIGQAQRLLGLEGRVSRFVAAGDLDRDAAALDAVAGGALALTRGGTAADLDRLTQSFHLNLTAFGFLAFVVGLFIVNGAIGLAFEQRRGTFRTLRACGVSARGLALALLAEILLLTPAAAVIGLLAGRAIASALMPDVAATLRGLYDAPVSEELRLGWSWWLSGLAVALLGALVSAGGALYRAARLPVLEAARPAAWVESGRRIMRRQAVAGAGGLVLAAILARHGASLTAGFTLLAALLLGAALLLPSALSLALRGAARLARGPLTQWAVADARQALGGLSLALMALMLALAANVGVGAMVGSFRLAFEGWLDRRLAAEIYVDPDTSAQAAALERLADGLPEVEAILPTLRAETRVEGLPVELLGVTPHPTYSERWPALAAAPAAWEAVAAGEGAFVSEQLARRLRLDLGDALSLPSPEGVWRVEVVGVHPDYGNPKGQAVVDLDALAARAPAAERGSYGLRVAPEAVDEVVATLRGEPALEGVEVIDQRSVKAFSLAVFERTFAVTGALNVLTFGVAGAALFTSLATLSALRLPQLAPVWAMGVTRRRLALVELVRTVGLAVGAAVLAVPLGVALAWALVAVVNVQAFGWRLPLAWFPGDWLRLGLLALVVATLAAALPARRLARTPPARLLAVFSQER